MFALFFLAVMIIPASALASTSGLPLVDESGHQAFPRIFGQNVVYANNGGTNWGLSYINLSTKEQRDIVSPVTGVVGYEGEYDISGTKIVYRYGVDVYGHEIYLYDISSGTSKKISSNGYGPSISGNYIVWYTSNNGIVLYDIALDKTKEITASGTAGMPGGFVRPAVSGNKIVYEADANPVELYLYDINSEQSSKIGIGRQPRIYGDYIIWSGGFGGSDPVTLYQISTQTQKVIGTGKAGEIYGNTVVYWSAVDSKVHLYSISSGKTIVGFGNGGGFTGPDIYEKTLVWADNRTSPSNLSTVPLTDIYFSTLQVNANGEIVESIDCTSWTYSSWSSCSSSGSQTRSVVSSSPSSCTGGSPVLSQSCTYTPPVPSCTVADWSCGSWGICSQGGNQKRTCEKTSNCQGGIQSATTSQSCTPTQQPKPETTVTPPPVYQPPQPSCTADTWTCGDWNACSLSGVQNRSCKKTFDCSSVETAPPTTDQYCEAPNRPAQQIPQDSDAISNQDTIIKATVKLLCVIDENRGMWGSGTVIDSSGTILTNKHVIDGTLGCLVGFINNSDDEPYFGDRQIADILKVSSTEDVATIKMRNPKNKKLTYINVANSNSNLRLGTKINIYGYPIKFGTNITYTSGDFSGTNGSYLKTTAIIESGNSGGGAYLSDGNFIGIPTAVIKGELNALGYILSINTVNAWLGNSAIASRGNSNQNNFSRVSSVLENIDLKKLDSIKLLLPKTDDKGNNIIPPVTPTTNQGARTATEQPQTNQSQMESTIVESNDKGQKVNPSQDSPAQSEKKPEEEKGGDSSVNIPEQRRSVVANAVQEISSVAERSGGIGEEIKAIAQTQTQNQEKLETGLQKIQDRSGFTKFFIGPNYGEIKASEKLLEQNKEQIQKLNELGVKLSNKGDKQKIEEQIQLLEQTTQQIETSLSDAQSGFSLLGWMFRLFAK